MPGIDGPILGTVVLAGVNAGGVPHIIDGTYLVAGVDADGEAHHVVVDDDGALSAALTYLQSQLSADVTMTNANQFYDGPSVSLTSGTWLLIASVLFRAAGAGTGVTGKIWDGTTVIGAGEYSVPANSSSQVPIIGVVTVTATTTYKVSLAGATAGCVFKAAPIVNSPGNFASTLIAVKIG